MDLIDGALNALETLRTLEAVGGGGDVSDMFMGDK